MAVPIPVAAASPTTLATSTSSMALQHPAQDKVAYLHDGSLLIGYYDGSSAIVDQVKNPSTSPSVQQLRSISGDEVTLYTQPGAGTTDIWVQVGAELSGSAPREQIQHGTYDGTSFSWDSLTTIPGTIAPGRQDPSVTWTGKWLIATWWDDVLGSNSDQVFLNWTTDKTGKTGWLSSALQMTTTGQNIVQVSVRHSAKLQATVLVYDARCAIWTRTLLDSTTDPSLSNWTSEANVDGADDCGFGFGGPQIAIDESNGNVHVFKAVTNSNGTSWSGVTYWHGTPDATPMSSGSISWSSRLIIDSSASNSDPPDVAGAVDSNGKVYVFWVTSVSSGALKYTTLVSPYTSASSVVTIAVSGSQPRYPHVPAQAPLTLGYVPLLYQSGTGSPYSIVLDTTLAGSTGDTTPPSIPTGLTATVKSGTEIDLGWNASTDNVAVTGYTIYRNGSQLATVGGSPTAYADKTAAQGVAYTYRVDAFDAAGNHSAQSASASATIPDTSPPTVPTGLIATPAAGEVDLSWTASSDNVAVSGYGVYRNGTKIGQVSGSTTTYADKTITQGTAYSYTVDAFDAAGNRSAQSAPATVNTPDTTPPSVPANLTATTSNTSLRVDLSWATSRDNIGVTGYSIYRNGTKLTTVGPATTSYTDNAVGLGVSYAYTVDAFDAAGNHSAQSTAAQVTTPQQILNSLGGILTSAPAAASSGPNQSSVFVRGTDNALWYRTWDGTTWGGWIRLGGVLTSDPSAVSWGSNRIDVFVRGTDNGLWQRTWDGTGWGNWQSLGGILTSAPSSSSWGVNRLDVFVRGTDYGLWQRSYDGTSWGSWQSLGGILTSNPSAISSTSSQIDVFGRGTDNGLWQISFSATGWGTWKSLGGVLASGPAASSCAAGHLDVFVLGSDRGLWQLGYNGASWSLWRWLQGDWTSNPAAVCPPTTTSGVLVVVRGTDNALWQETTAGS